MKDRRINCLSLDGSAESEEVFEWYLDNFHCANDLLVLLHVRQASLIDILGMTKPINKSYEEHIHDYVMENNFMDKYQRLCEHEHIDYEVVIETTIDPPGPMICALAKRTMADSVILGRRDLNGITRAFLGSTSDYVLHKSSVPVVVVPPK